jgi:hypothetical protein
MMRNPLAEIEELDTMQRKLMQTDPRHPAQPRTFERDDNVFRRSAQNMGMAMIDDPAFHSPAPPRTPPIGGGKAQDPMVQKIRQLREEAVKEGNYDPAFFKELDDMENHLVGVKPAQLYPGNDMLNSHPGAMPNMNQRLNQLQEDYVADGNNDPEFFRLWQEVNQGINNPKQPQEGIPTTHVHHTNPPFMPPPGLPQGAYGGPMAVPP